MYGGGDMYCYDQYGPTGTRPSSSQCSSLPCSFQGNGVTIKCVRPDQAPTGGSNTGNGNMEEWCAAWRSNTCQATCDKYKGTMTADESGRCVDGCKTMTESMCNGSYNGGGSYNGQPYNGQPVRCVYPNGVTLYCRAPHVDCSKTQGGPILTSQQVGANGSTAQCDPVSGGHDGEQTEVQIRVLQAATAASTTAMGATTSVGGAAGAPREAQATQAALVTKAGLPRVARDTAEPPPTAPSPGARTN